MATYIKGLNEAQLGFLDYFKSTDPPRVYMPNYNVFRQQRTNLLECKKLAKELIDECKILRSKTENFSDGFAAFDDKTLATVSDLSDKWLTKVSKLESVYKIINRTYVPEDVKEIYRRIINEHNRVEHYYDDIREYGNVRDFENTTKAVYNHAFNAARPIVDKFIEVDTTAISYEEIGFGSEFFRDEDIDSMISIPVGITNGKPTTLDFDCSGSLIGYMVQGSTGSGKSSLLYSLIINGAMKYSPRALQFYLLDFKSERSETFKVFRSAKNPIPHIKQLSIKNDAEAAEMIFDGIKEEQEARSKLFEKYDVNNIRAYNDAEIRAAEDTGVEPQILPRLIVIIDECHMAFEDEKHTGLNRELANKFSILTRQGRSYGIHFIVTTQVYNIILASIIGKQLEGRCSFKMINANDDSLFPRSAFDKIKNLPYRSAMLLSRDGGENCEQVRVAFHNNAIDVYTKKIRERWAKYINDYVTFELGNEEALEVPAERLSAVSSFDGKPPYTCSNLRDYSRFAVANEKYSKLKLSDHIARMLNEKVARMREKLLYDISVIEEFDKQMANLTAKYDSLPKDIRSGKLEFQYSKSELIKNELKVLPSWIKAVDKLKNWVDNLDNDDRTLVTGIPCYSKFNLNGEYDNYLHKAKDFQKLLEAGATFDNEVELINYFNRRLKELTDIYNLFSQEIRDAKILFKYSSWTNIEDKLRQARKWVEAVDDLSSYVDLLPEVQRNLLVSRNATAESNKKDYEKYLALSKKLTTLIAEAEYFYNACRVSNEIDVLSKSKTKTQESIARVNDAHIALKPEAKKYFEKRFETDLNSLLETSGKLDKLKSTAKELRETYDAIPEAIKKGAPRYAYDAFESLQKSIAKAKDWQSDFVKAEKDYNDLKASIEIPTVTKKVFEDLKSNKINNAISVFANIKAAYDFEDKIKKNQDKIKNDDNYAMNCNEELNRLQKAVIGYIPDNFVKLIKDRTSVIDEYRKLQTRIDIEVHAHKDFESKYSPVTFKNASRAVGHQKDTASGHLKELESLIEAVDIYNEKKGKDLSDFDKLNEIIIFYKNHISDIEKISRYMEFYKWAISFENNKKQYSESNLGELGAKYDNYCNNISDYKKFDSDGELERIFESVKAIIDDINKKQRKIKNKSLMATIFHIALPIVLLALCVALLAAVPLTHSWAEQNNYYWWWLLASAVAIAGACTAIYFIIVGFYDIYDDEIVSTISIVLGCIGAAYLILYTLPMYIRFIGYPAWYMTWVVMAAIVAVLIAFFVDESELYIQCACQILLVVFILLMLGSEVLTRYSETAFMYEGFWRHLVNAFIFLWTVISGLVIGIYRTIMLVFGAGFWNSSAYGGVMMAHTLNIALYSILGPYIAGFRWLIW